MRGSRRLAKARRTVGVIGGMGPQGTADFFSKLIECTPADEERDHLHVLIDSDPDVPNRIAAIRGTGPSPASRLQAIARNLERAGANFIVMPCNTAHAFADEVSEAVDIPFLNMIEIVSDVVAGELESGARVGLLAAEGCIESDLYQSSLRKRNLEQLTLAGSQMDRFMTAVLSVKAKGATSFASAELESLVEQLRSEGAEAIVAACTEVPVALATRRRPLPVFDATLILAKATVAQALSVKPAEIEAGALLV